MKEVRKFRPFWSFDVVRTEAWLSAMHQEGKHLKDVLLSKRVFVFSEGIKETKEYCIFLNNQGNDNHFETFERVVASKGYEFYKSKEERGSLRPSHETFYKRNRTFEQILFFVILYQFFGFFLLFGAMTVLLFSSDFSFFTDLDGYDQVALSISFVLGLFVNLLIVFSYIKLRKTNNVILEPLHVDTKESFSKEALKALKKDKRLVKKLKLAWMYAPDKLERYIEDLESKGLNLVKVNKVGNVFYFVKGVKRTVKVHIDYQSSRDSSYIALNQESGWQVMFSSWSKRFAYTLFLKPYTHEVPEFYSDNSSKLDHAKRLALHNSLLLIPLSMLYALLIVSHVRSFSQDTGFFTNLWRFNIIVFTFVSVEFMVFGLRSVLYYKRVKRNLEG